MTTAIVTKMYFVNLDSPTFPPEMSPEERLSAWLGMARIDPEWAFKNLVISDIDGILED
jgi:hypothetical protein